MAAYYNEIDAYAAQWLRNLIDSNLIAEGDVDERSIRDVAPDDLVGYTQCHFFAGVGVWSHALRLAGWPDDREVWTGSCPCQPFSAAGQRGGVDDARHLWPDFFRLIGERRPRVVFGEQVASKDGLGWLDIVHADLEGTGYAVGFKDLCAASIGAPHIRQRLYFVADAESGGRREEQPHSRGRASGIGARETQLHAGRGSFGELADDTEQGRLTRGRLGEPGDGRRPSWEQSGRLRDAGGVADTEGLGRIGRAHDEDGRRRELTSGRVCTAGRLGDNNNNTGLEGQRDRHHAESGRDGAVRSVAEAGEPCGLEHDGRPGPVNGVWRDADWLFCRDGKWRPVESGTFPLAHGAPARVGRLRAYGNAIVPQVAAEIIGAFLDARP